MSAGRSSAGGIESARLPAAFEAYADESLAQAPAGGPGKNGLLEAAFARDGENPTRLIRDYVKVPYHLTGALETDPAPGLATLVAQEPTGGVAQGDRHRMAIDARPGARAHVTTQSATKVHSMRANYAHLDASLRAAAGSYLEYVPGPTIVNEDARCLQTIDVDLADDACVVVADVLVPDGLSDHEPFEFDHYHARVEAEHDGRLVCADAVDLRPSNRDPRDPASVGEYGVVGSLYVFAPSGDGGETGDGSDDVDEAGSESGGGGTAEDRNSDSDSDFDFDLEALIDGIRDRIGDREDVRAGVSMLPEESGAIVRILGHREADVTETLRAAWDETRRRRLGVGVPADRRY
ncbi:urease accessory protein UreD [Natronorubrum sp. JWXQ-INN-674]|uniref:Urease accessory protein UreD n=1 Tax=Natronorubrum halalkaliphilum TaxID=2691917 RepID=A0A6B0VMJ6_9EURY|nr:urease accessory protein UreD [Natronorubrum halalkaliphilum]MXV62317.1 urease accessory protein UreD [Natronorubrum halalkaliphilum]